MSLHLTSLNSISGHEPVIVNFIQAIIDKDSAKLKSCLHKDGAYEVVEKTGRYRTRKVRGFMNWFEPIMFRETIQLVEFDQCTACKIGCPVLLFNQGVFPIITTDGAAKSKKGLAIEVKNGVIFEIKICVNFKFQENKWQWIVNGENARKNNPEYWAKIDRENPNHPSYDPYDDYKNFENEVF
jgi:hypothetical protein